MCSQKPRIRETAHIQHLCESLASLCKLVATQVFLVVAVVLALYPMLSFSEIKCFIVVTEERKKKMHSEDKTPEHQLLFKGIMTVLSHC